MDLNESIPPAGNLFNKNPKPRYMAVGTGISSRNYPNGNIDGLKVIGSLTPKQLEIFLYFRDRIIINNDSNWAAPGSIRNVNEVSLLNMDDDYTQKTKKLMQMNNNIKALIEKKLLKKGKKKCYMVNPFVLVPFDEFPRHAATWLYYDLIDISKGFTLDIFLAMDKLTVEQAIEKQLTD